MTVNFRKIAVVALTALAMLVPARAADEYHIPQAQDDRLTAAAGLILYYNECVKVPDDQVPLKVRQALTYAEQVWGAPPLQKRTAEFAQEVEDVKVWCTVAREQFDKVLGE